ncbi:hypothetical protein K439DRAFT_1641502 [Ramaria rubella]|nr:hypothetical protein K439DRAFT_1641502 [Ramaria rubella]
MLAGEVLRRLFFLPQAIIFTCFHFSFLFSPSFPSLPFLTTHTPWPRSATTVDPPEFANAENLLTFQNFVLSGVCGCL